MLLPTVIGCDDKINDGIVTWKPFADLNGHIALFRYRFKNPDRVKPNKNTISCFHNQESSNCQRFRKYMSPAAVTAGFQSQRSVTTVKAVDS